MSGSRLKLTTYFGERDRVGDRFLADELFDVYGRHGIQSSILLRGIAGFGLRRRQRAAGRLTLSEDLPLVSIALDEPERIERALEEVVAMKRSGLVTLERARLVPARGVGEMPPVTSGRTRKLSVHLGRRARAGGEAAFAAVCALLRSRGVAGATTLLGVDGTLRGVRERARFFGSNPDVPAVVISIGEEARIAAVLPELRELVPEAALILERVEVCKRDGARLASPPRSTGGAAAAARWQKLSVYASESDLHDGRPIHAWLASELLRAGAAGATAVRGIWGFHGDHEPHGDRVLRLRRRVPVVTTVIDAPERIAEWFAIVDEATREHGLVTSETVPALASPGEAQLPPASAAASLRALLGANASRSLLK